MTLDDKSAAVPGWEQRITNMVPPQEGYTFSEVVDEACEKLKNRQIKYSIRRIQEMEDRLYDLERELDIFLMQKNR